jgi:hypothetical protein
METSYNATYFVKNKTAYNTSVKFGQEENNINGSVEPKGLPAVIF